jgi:hypothetical protein
MDALNTNLGIVLLLAPWRAVRSDLDSSCEHQFEGANPSDGVARRFDSAR